MKKGRSYEEEELAPSNANQLEKRGIGQNIKGKRQLTLTVD